MICGTSGIPGSNFAFLLFSAWNILIYYILTYNALYYGWDIIYSGCLKIQKHYMFDFQMKQYVDGIL